MLYFDPTDCRWQLIHYFPNQEIPPDQSERSHFVQPLFQMLASVHRCIGHACPELRDGAALPSADSSLDFGRHLTKIKRRVGDEVFKQLLDAHIRISSEAGLTAARAAWRGGERRHKKLDRASILQILSSLWMRHDWDFAGSAYRSIKTFVPVSQPALKGTLQDSVYRAQMLAYVIREQDAIRAGASEDHNPLETPSSLDVWEYRQRKWNRISQPKDSFFRLCPVREVEYPAYRFYASCYDTLSEQVLGKGVKYVIAYPLIAFGFVHFLQVYLTPGSQDAPPSAEELGKDFINLVHQEPQGRSGRAQQVGQPSKRRSARKYVDLTHFKASLKEALFDVRRRGFEWKCAGAVDKLSRKARSPETIFRQVFGQHAPELLLIDHLAFIPPTINSAKKRWEQWGYSAPTLALGYQWTSLAPSTQGGLPFPKRWRNRISTLRSGRRHQSQKSAESRNRWTTTGAIWEKRFASATHDLFINTSAVRVDRGYEWLEDRIAIMSGLKLRRGDGRT